MSRIRSGHPRFPAVAGCRARRAAPGFRPREVPVSAREDPGERGRPLHQVESGWLQADARLDLRRRSRPPRGREGREGRQRRGLGPRALRLEALHLGPDGRGRDQPRRIGRGKGHVRGGPCEGGRRRDGGRPEGERGLEAASVPRLQLRLHQPELRLAASHRSRRRRSRSASSTRRSRRTVRSSSTGAIARIVYTGEDEIRGKTCRSYRISGPGIENTTGTIWWDPKSGWLEKVEIPFRGQPGLEQLQARARGDRAHDAGRLEEVRRGLAGEGERDSARSQGAGAPRFARTPSASGSPRRGSPRTRESFGSSRRADRASIAWHER